jgi:hypothetical protein
MGAIPDAGQWLRLFVVDAGFVFLDRLLLDEGLPLLVVAFEPTEMPFGGIIGWSPLDSVIGRLVGGPPSGVLIMVGFHGSNILSWTIRTWIVTQVNFSDQGIFKRHFPRVERRSESGTCMQDFFSSIRRKF